MNWRSLLGGLLWFGVALAGAAEIRLSGKEASLPLAPLIEAYEDESGRMEIQDVVRQGAFSVRPELLHPGFTHSAIWLKFEFFNDSGLPLTRWLSVQPARLRDVSLFVRQEGGWRRTDAGTRLPFAEWPVSAVNAVLPLRIPPGQPLVAYLRVAGPVSISIAPTLWEPLAFREAEGHSRMVDGIFLGGMAVMPLIGLLLLFMLRDRAFLFNTLGMLTFCLGETSAKGYGFMYLWPNANDWAPRSLALGAMLGVGWHILFLRDLLATRITLPRADRLLLFLLAIEWLPGLGLLLEDYSGWARISAALNLLAMPIMVGVGILAVRRGIKAARYYLAAFAVLAVGGLLHLSSLLGFVPYIGAVEYALPVAMLLNNALMLVSVVDRVMLVRKEKEAAQNALLAVRVAHEAELEQAVVERTADLNAALVETRQAKETQSRLLAYVSHDLRAPLSTIINYAHLLGRHGDADVCRYNAAIERSALYQLDLIDDLVEFARGELDRLELVPAPAFLYDWLDGIATQAELLARQYGNRFFLETGSGIPPVAVFDAKRLRQVLINLLANAAKFTGDGNIRLDVQARPLAGNRVELAFAVIDTGAGIPPHDLERIFLPFERRETQREGWGLGLSIARQLVRAMGGEIEAQSTPGQGSRFSFRLTFDMADEADVLQPVQPFLNPPAFGSGKALLVVDDSEGSREYLRETLLAADFDVVCARDGAEALGLARGRRFDALLVDQAMPGMDAWELLRQLHEGFADAVPPVILCSAMPPQRPAGYPDGLAFNQALLKPVAADRLFRVLQGLFRRAPAQSGALPSAAMLAVLRRLIADGDMTEIEEWAVMLESSHPSYADFACRVREAVLRIDLGELATLSEAGPAVPSAEAANGAFPALGSHEKLKVST